MNILMTGGSGLLGRKIKEIDQTIFAPSSHELNITKLASIEKSIDTYKPDVFLHLAAATKPPEHEGDPTKGLTINIMGTANICLACSRRNKKLVYVSTDYVYTGDGPHKEDEPLLPPSRYAWSKLGGECCVQLLHQFLILRLSFGPVPFPWDKVYEDQYVSKLYVDEMAELVLKAIKSDASGVMNIGGPRISLEEYARKTRADIQTMKRPDWVPKDTSLDLTKMKSRLKI